MKHPDQIESVLVCHVNCCYLDSNLQTHIVRWVYLDRELPGFNPDYKHVSSLVPSIHGLRKECLVSAICACTKFS